MRYVIVVLSMLAGCDDKAISLGTGDERDARIMADIYTWECEYGDTGVDETWEGVFSYNVAMEYAPDALANRSIPAAGCTAGLDLFPVDAGSGGTDIPDVTAPNWSNEDSTGVLSRESAGFYATSVFANQRTCNHAEEILGTGTAISDAGSFSGAQTPAPGELSNIDVAGLDSETGLTFGAEAEVTWNNDGWTESWIQVRREQGGALLESVTCNTGGENSFLIDDTVWNLMSEFLSVDVTNLYIGVQNVDVAETADGQQVELITRAMHSAVIQD